MRAPAWAPQFWTTWRCWVRSAARLARISSRQRASSPSMISLPTAWSGRCSPGGATTVRHDPAARASAIVTWATAPSRARASSSVPATVNAKSLRIRSADAVAGRDAAVEAVAVVVDQGRGHREPLAVERPVHHRRHPPAGDGVLAQLEQALAHRGTPGLFMRAPATRAAPAPPAPRRGPRRGAARPRAARRSGRRTPGRRRRRLRPPARWTGARPGRPASRAIDVESRPGIPHGSIRPKSARSTSTLSAMPW